MAYIINARSTGQPDAYGTMQGTNVPLGTVSNGPKKIT